MKEIYHNSPGFVKPDNRARELAIAVFESQMAMDRALGQVLIRMNKEEARERRLFACAVAGCGLLIVGLIGGAIYYDQYVKSKPPSHGWTITGSF